MAVASGWASRVLAQPLLWRLVGMVASQFARREVPVQHHLYFNDGHTYSSRDPWASWKIIPACKVQIFPRRSFEQKKTVLRGFQFSWFDPSGHSFIMTKEEMLYSVILCVMAVKHMRMNEAESQRRWHANFTFQSGLFRENLWKDNLDKLHLANSWILKLFEKFACFACTFIAPRLLNCLLWPCAIMQECTEELIQTGITLMWFFSIVTKVTHLHWVILNLVIRVKQSCLLSIINNIPLVGHLGIIKTKDWILRRYYSSGMFKNIAEYCHTCAVCQRSVPRWPARAPQRSPCLLIILKLFQCIAMDLVVQMPQTEHCNRFILTIVNYATRYPETLPSSMEGNLLSDSSWLWGGDSRIQKEKKSLPHQPHK